MLNKLNNIHVKNLIYYLIPLLLIIIFIIISDPKTSTDTQRFIRWSKDMNLNIFEAYDYLSAQREIKGVMFFFSVIYFKIANLFGDYWKNGFVILNLICFSLILFLIKKKLSQSVKFYYIIPFFLIINYDFIFWSNYLLTDFFFQFLCFIVITNLVFQKKIYFSLFFLFIIIFTRPPGIVLVLVLFQYLFVQNSIENNKILFLKIISIIILYIFSTNFLPLVENLNLSLLLKL